jgi:hypothetical protein
MPQVGFEPTIPAGERPQTYTLDRAATGTGTSYILGINILSTIKILISIEIWFSFKMTDCITEAYQI